jgi:hypothetical protein
MRGGDECDRWAVRELQKLTAQNEILVAKLDEHQNRQPRPDDPEGQRRWVEVDRALRLVLGDALIEAALQKHKTPDLKD